MRLAKVVEYNTHSRIAGLTSQRGGIGVETRDSGGKKGCASSAAAVMKRATVSDRK